MTELLTAAQMRAIERAAINSGSVTGLELMERAGQGVVQAIFEEWPVLAQPRDNGSKSNENLHNDAHRAVVLCGPGNNGGDGFVIARLLEDLGWEVDVLLYGDPAKLPPDAKVNYARWGAVKPLEDRDLTEIAGSSLVIDALFGTGLSRPINVLGRVLRSLCDSVDAGRGQNLADRAPHWPPVIAVDVPSGLCADSGKALQDPASDRDAIVRGGKAALAAADLTVTFHARKCGHFLGMGPKHCSKVVVADIGLQGVGLAQDRAKLVTGSGAAVWRAQGHKYSHGHALVLSGDIGKGGAARLAARGALRVGAGAVTVACPPAALIENAAQLNAIMLRELPDASALPRVLGDKRINALCLGPGLGTGPREAGLVAAALGADAPRAMVLDADALTLLAQESTLFADLHDCCVLTPHAGEFARLFPDIAARLDAPATTGPAYSKVDATRDAAKRAGCVVLFKGPDTTIADPSGRCSINASVYDRAVPWLATAGSGDVLAGFITGLLARGIPPMRAAEISAWLHTESALQFGPGLIAEDLPEQLPKVFRQLGL